MRRASGSSNMRKCYQEESLACHISVSCSPEPTHQNWVQMHSEYSKTYLREENIIETNILFVDLVFWSICYAAYLQIMQ